MAREKVLSILRSPRPPNTDRLPPPQDVSKSLSAFASALYRALWQLLRIKYYLDSLGIPRNGKRFVGFWNLAKDLLSSMMRGLSEVDSDSGLLFNKFPLLSHQSWVLKRLTKILKEIEAVGVKVQLNPQCESLRGRCGVRIGWLVGQFRGLMKMTQKDHGLFHHHEHENHSVPLKRPHLLSHTAIKVLLHHMHDFRKHTKFRIDVATDREWISTQDCSNSWMARHQTRRLYTDAARSHQSSESPTATLHESDSFFNGLSDVHDSLDVSPAIVGLCSKHNWISSKVVYHRWMRILNPLSNTNISEPTITPPYEDDGSQPLAKATLSFKFPLLDPADRPVTTAWPVFKATFFVTERKLPHGSPVVLGLGFVKKFQHHPELRNVLLKHAVRERRASFWVIPGGLFLRYNYPTDVVGPPMALGLGKDAGQAGEDSGRESATGSESNDCAAGDRNPNIVYLGSSTVGEPRDTTRLSKNNTPPSSPPSPYSPRSPLSQATFAEGLKGPGSNPITNWGCHLSAESTTHSPPGPRAKSPIPAGDVTSLVDAPTPSSTTLKRKGADSLTTPHSGSPTKKRLVNGMSTSDTQLSDLVSSELVTGIEGDLDSTGLPPDRPPKCQHFETTFQRSSPFQNAIKRFIQERSGSEKIGKQVEASGGCKIAGDQLPETTALDVSTGFAPGVLRTSGTVSSTFGEPATRLTTVPPDNLGGTTVTPATTSSPIIPGKGQNAAEASTKLRTYSDPPSPVPKRRRLNHGSSSDAPTHAAAMNGTLKFGQSIFGGVSNASSTGLLTSTLDVPASLRFPIRGRPLFRCPLRQTFPGGSGSVREPRDQLSFGGGNTAPPTTAPPRIFGDPQPLISRADGASTPITHADDHFVEDSQYCCGFFGQGF